MIRIGVDYYPEHWPESGWAADIRRMKDAGVTTVRIAEFAWGLLEPEEGRFNFDWLDRIVAMLGKAGIEIILGTPTNCAPLWLYRSCPETLAVERDGSRTGAAPSRKITEKDPRPPEQQISPVGAGLFWAKSARCAALWRAPARGQRGIAQSGRARSGRRKHSNKPDTIDGSNRSTTDVPRWAGLFAAIIAQADGNDNPAGAVLADAAKQGGGASYEKT